MTTFKDRLLAALSDKSMSAAELSRLSGIDEATISNYKKEKYVPKQKKAEAIANALGVPTSWLLGAKEESTTVLSLREKKVVETYRNNPQVQQIINALLDIVEETARLSFE